jgi:hypothetical protein
MKTGEEVLRELREAEAERKKGRKESVSTPLTERLLVCCVCDQPGGMMVNSDEGKRHPDCEVAKAVRKRASNRMRRLVQKLKWKRKRARS